VKKPVLGCLLFFCAATACLGQSQGALCPRHIETPDYPPFARLAHVAGKIALTVSIDANGAVQSVEATTDDPLLSVHPFLQKYAVENIKLWTFVKPPFVPYRETVVYDYEFDASLPGEGGPSSLPSITKVKFDLPDRVTIVTNLRFIDVSRSQTHN
jgi:Gram-negative bacterial TonB protein C-terminal